MPSHVAIDESRLRRNVLAYLRSEEGRLTLVKFGTTFALALCFTAAILVMGVCFAITMVYAVVGLKLIAEAIQLKFFRSLGREFTQRPQELFPLIARGVMIGPSGKFALALGSLRPYREYDFDRLTDVANELFEVYAEIGDGARPEHAALRAILRNDKYEPHRRQRVPEPYARGLDLLIFDVKLEGNETYSTPDGSVLMSFVADPGAATDRVPTGELYPIPWSVVAGAVLIDGEPTGIQLDDDELATADVVGAAPAPARSSWGALGCLLGGVLLFAGCCGGLGWVVNGVFQAEADKVAEIVRDHPIVIREIGPIERCQFSFLGSLSEGGKNEKVFQVEGAKGKGRLIATERWYEYRSIVLKTPTAKFELLDGEEP